jgi:CBS domain containing-hemolysin-like protein
MRMRNLASDGNKRASLTLKLEDDYDKLLSTVLICKNAANIVAASIGVYAFSEYFSERSLLISTFLIILIILFFGEITPRALASGRPDKYAMMCAPAMRIFIAVLSPISIIFDYWKKLINKIFKYEEHAAITEDELITMIDEVENEGVIDKSESELIRSAIEFNDTTVEDIFTPRIDIIGIDENDTVDEIKEKFLVSGYSRLPVYRDNIDNIVGVMHEKDFYQGLSRKEKDLKKLTSTVLYVTPNKKISELLRELQHSKAHMAIVIDEYGGTAGLVTMEDIIEELVGEIWDEHDEVIEWFKKIDEDKFLISCNADIDDAFELLDIEAEELDVSTVNGWVMLLFEGIPEEGSNIKYKNLDITVTKAEANRVLEITVEKLKED